MPSPSPRPTGRPEHQLFGSYPTAERSTNACRPCDGPAIEKLDPHPDQNQEDTGPWTEEALYLLDWWPPGKPKPTGAGKDKPLRAGRDVLRPQHATRRIGEA